MKIRKATPQDLRDMMPTHQSISHFQGKYEFTIEPLLFGDFHIGLYINQDLVLDHKYFTNDAEAAILVFLKLIKTYGKKKSKPDKPSAELV